jgi:hypothetical protein
MSEGRLLNLQLRVFCAWVLQTLKHDESTVVVKQKEAGSESGLRCEKRSIFSLAQWRE